MNTNTFYHAIKIDLDKCIGCAHCMRVCPTEAIRITGGKAVLDEATCVDCGECFKACPVNAYSVNQDDIQKIMQFKYRVALVPSVYTGHLPDNITAGRAMELLKTLGFTHVYELEAGVNILKDRMNELIGDQALEKPIISSFCPAIIRLIQVKFPGLTDNISLLKSPADLAAIYYRKKLEEEGLAPEDIGIFYITPCPAKIAAVKSPVGEDKSVIDGVINLDYAYNKVVNEINKRPITVPNTGREVIMDNNGMRWCLTNGEAKHMQGRSLSIDGINNVINFLERVENEDVLNVDFLELRACDESCAGGILNVKDRFLIVESVNNRARNVRDQIESNKKVAKSFDDLNAYLNEKIGIDEIEPRTNKLDEDMGKALKKMERVRELMCFLPGIDCGACGSPSCSALAKDVVMRKANLSHCVFMQRSMEKHRTLSNDHSIRIIEKIWGESRLEKDCTKKGAKYEGQ